MYPNLNPIFNSPDNIMREIVEWQEQQFIKQDIHNLRTWLPNKIKKRELPTYLKSDPFLWQCFKRLHYEDKNLLMVIVGEVGSGKSHSAINIANKIDITPLGGGEYKLNFIVKHDSNNEPTPETRVVFSSLDLVRLVRSGLPKGSVIIWDEAGIGNDNTNWYEKKSKFIKHILQSFRAQNLMLILTVPDEESIALFTRRLVHVMINVHERDDNFVYCDIYWYDRNRRLDKIYKKTTSFMNPITGEPTKIKNYMLRDIPKSLANPYKRIKQKILGDLNGFYEKEMALMEKLEIDKIESKEAMPKKKFDLVGCVTFIRAAHAEKVMNERKGRYEPSKIMFVLESNGWQCSLSQARSIAANLLK